MTGDEREDELQNAVIHEGAAPDGRDSNEDADDKATITEPGEDRAG